MADTKISALPEDTAPTFDDLLVTVHDPGGTPATKKATLANLFHAISTWMFAADAGANDTYTATLSPAPAAYVTGQHYRFKANTANTGACTINFNALGAIAIKKAAGGITTDLSTNDIRAGQWVDLVYDGTNMQMQSVLGNAAAAGSGDFGYINIPQNSQSTAYTTVLGDQGKHILHPAADNNARTFTIDSNANVAYPIGTAITFIDEINTVTIAITSDTLTWADDGSTGSRTLAANGMATAIKITSTKWIISGTGLS